MMEHNLETSAFEYKAIKWQTIDKSAVKRCFDLSFCKVVKENRVREVYYTAESENAIPQYFVKVAKPERSFRKIKTLFRNKVKAEFDSFILLKKHDIPVAKYVAWGRKGQSGYLVTEALNDYEEMGDLFSKAEKSGSHSYSSLILHITDFLCKMIKSSIFHPDFHFGNLMGREKATGYELCLLDVYGVSEKKLSQNEKMAMLQILVGHLWKLESKIRKEVIEKISDTFGYDGDKTVEQLYEFWRREMGIHFKKRITKYFSKSSFLISQKDKVGKWLICKRFGLKNEEFLSALKGGSCSEISVKSYELSQKDQAERCWRSAFATLQYSIPAADYYAYLVKSDKICLFYQNLEKSCLDEQLAEISKDVSAELRDQFYFLLVHFYNAGVDLKELSLSDFSWSENSGLQLNRLDHLKFVSNFVAGNFEADSSELLNKFDRILTI